MTILFQTERINVSLCVVLKKYSAEEILQNARPDTLWSLILDYDSQIDEAASFIKNTLDLSKSEILGGEEVIKDRTEIIKALLHWLSQYYDLSIVGKEICKKYGVAIPKRINASRN